MKYPEIRRKDRATSEDWIRQHIQDAPYAVITVSCDNRPISSVVTFVYSSDDHAAYFHTSRDGFVSTLVKSGVHPASLVCASMGRLLPAKRAGNLSVEYRSIIAYGGLSIVGDLEGGKAAMEALNAKYFPHLVPGQDMEPIADSELAAVSVFRFDIEHWSGKQKREAEEFPGAFHFGQG